MSVKKIEVRISGADSDTAYVALSRRQGESQTGLVAKTISLDDIINNFKGPHINLDFDSNGMLVGIEILA